MFQPSAWRAVCAIIFGPSAAAMTGRRGRYTEDGFITALSAE